MRQSETRATVWAWLERILWLGLVAFALFRFGPQLSAAIGVGGEPGSQMPDFAVSLPNDSTLQLSDLRGSVVLVNYWASWCAPCRVEMPGFQRVYERYAGDGFVILGLSRDVTESAMVEYARDRGVTYPVAMATGASVRSVGGLRGLPTSVLIDREGRVRRKIYGYLPGFALERAVARLLEE